MSGDFLPEGTPRGLPGPLPAGERILWQSKPTTLVTMSGVRSYGS